MNIGLILFIPQPAKCFDTFFTHSVCSACILTCLKIAHRVEVKLRALRANLFSCPSEILKSETSISEKSDANCTKVDLKKKKFQRVTIQFFVLPGCEMHLLKTEQREQFFMWRLSLAPLYLQYIYSHGQLNNNYSSYSY